MERIGTAVIGGGAVGCATLLELAQAGLPDLVLLERMPGVGEVQSGRNSGVVHAGIYYRAGSLKAELCVEANALMAEFCAPHGVPLERVGKLVVATSDEELGSLEAILVQAQENGVPDVRLLTRREVRALEPNVDVPAALHVPTTAIVDAARYTRVLVDLACEAGASVLTSFEVTAVELVSTGFAVIGRRGGREESFEAETIVNAAGLHCDVIARWVNPTLEVEVTPLRGEYCKINRRRHPGLWLNGLNIYPVPEPLDVHGEATRMVGVHLTPTFALDRGGAVTVGDTVTVGPEFRCVSERDDYERDRMPPEFFLERARRFFPSLELADLEADFAGIMVHCRGMSDFTIRRDELHPGCIQLLGIDSPGLTCSLAIARRVRRLLTT